MLPAAVICFAVLAHACCLQRHWIRCHESFRGTCVLLCVCILLHTHVCCRNEASVVMFPVAEAQKSVVKLPVAVIVCLLAYAAAICVLQKQRNTGHANAGCECVFGFTHTQPHMQLPRRSKN